MKKQAKRWLAMLLSLTMVLSLLPATALPAFAAGTIKPDGAVTDTWTQDNDALADSTCEKQDGKLHLKPGDDVTNNGGTNPGPAVFVNEELNNALASNSGETEVTFDLKPLVDGLCFGIYFNYKDHGNGMYVGYNGAGATDWFWQSYVNNSGSYDGESGVALAQNTTYHVVFKWNPTEGSFSFQIDDTVILDSSSDSSAKSSYDSLVTSLGSLKTFGIKLGKKNDGTIADAEISNFHYTGQTEVSVYNISGTVKDDADTPAALAGVEVTASAADGAAYTATTDAEGGYTLENLPAATYTLTVTKEGYDTKTETVTVSNADVTKDITMTAADTVDIATDGVNNGDWTQVGGKGVDGETAPAVEEGRLVLTSGYTNGHKISGVSVPTALFTSAKMNAELAAFQGDTKTLSFTLTPETRHSANNNNQDGTLPDYLAFGVVVDSNESNQGLFMGYSDVAGDKWLFQSYGGSGSYNANANVTAPTPGVPIKFEITWTRDTLTLKINGEVADTRSMAGLTQTDKIAFCVGGSFYETDDHSLQDNRQTVIRISDLHYSGQDTVAARYVKGTVTCDGEPVEGATVTVQGDLTGAYTQTTDPAGKYSVALPIRDAAYALSATKDGYDTVEKTVSVTAGADKATLAEVDFELTELPVITGTVKDTKGNAILGATVKSDLRGNAPAAVTDSNGAFTVIGAVDGTHTLTISAEGYETATKEVAVNGSSVSAGEIVLEERQIPSYTLSTGDMDVTVAQGFPQVIKYTLKDGKSMYGQTAELDTIEINGVAVKPTVTSQLSSDNKKVTYSMVIDESNNSTTGVTATITAELRVGLDDLNNPSSAAAGRTLGFYITGVEYANNSRLDHPVDTIEIPNHSLVSVRSTEEGAAVTGAKLASNTISSGDVTYQAKGNENAAGWSDNYFAAFVYNNGLSASLASNSAYGTGSAGSGTYPVHLQFEAKDGGESVALALSSTLWYYDHDITQNEANGYQKLSNTQLTQEQRIIAPLDEPYAKVVITGDMNGNGKVDWQDGAIAYRETVMHIPAGGEGVADAVNLRISMNFGSMATNPFLIALDNVKRVAANTDGLGQFVLLKGYAGEGHDSNHPQYDNIGIRMGGPEDLLTLMEEGEKLGATFGIHINASEFYTEAITNEDQVLRYSAGNMRYGWNWLDQGISINAVYDYASGLRKTRLDNLYEIVKGHPFVVYVDVWGNLTSGREDDFQTRALSNEIVSHPGWRIAHEWSYGNPYESTFQHWVTDYTYGAYGDKGKLNSSVLRFLLNEYKDSFPPDFATFGGAANAPLLGGPAMQGFEGWQGDGEYNLSIYNTFNQMLATKFLQHYDIMEWSNATQPTLMWWWVNANQSSKTAGRTVNNDDGTITLQNQDANGNWNTYAGTTLWTPENQIKLQSADGSQTVVVTRGTDQIPDAHYDYEDGEQSEVVYRSRVITLNGKEILRGAPASAGEDTRFPANKATLQYLIPWYWDANGEPVAPDDEKLYHWNAQGGESEWVLPDGWTNLANVMVYELSDQGRGTGVSVSVSNGKVTLTAKANTAYVVTKGAGKAAAPEITYGEGLHLEDPSFNIDTPKGPWKIEGRGSAVHTTNSDGIGVMKMMGEVSVSQEMTGLVAGKTYVSYVAVDNRSNAKASMTITDDTGKVVATNYTERSIAKNYVSSYYLHNNHGVEAGGSYFQNMFVYFTPEAGRTYTMTLSREAGSGNVYFDDLRTVEYGFNYSGFGKGQTAQNDKGSAAIPVTYDPDTGAVTELHQDFENVPQGIWPFVVGPVESIADNRTHVSELNAPFTQAGWDVKKMDDVIDGNWSIKTNGLSGRNSLVYQTIPQNFRFEPNKVYTVSFDYEMGSAGAYQLVVGDGAYTGLDGLTVYTLDQTLSTTVPNNSGIPGNTTAKAAVGHIEFTVVGSESGQTWIGIYSKGNSNNQGTSGSAADFGGYKDFVLDNLSIELAPPEKNELALLLQRADAMEDSSIYTAVTGTDEAAWAALVSARTNGHTVFDNESATQAEITAAVDALKAALDNLVKVSISISGTVKNVNNRPVEGVELTLEDENYFPVGLTVTTDAEGKYEFVSKSGVELLPGTYHIKAQCTGYYVTTTGNIVVTKQDSEKTQDIDLEAEAPGAYVNDFNNGDIDMMGPIVDEPANELPTMEWLEYNGSGALKVTWNGRTGETRATNNVVDKTVAFANGTFSFDVTAQTTGARFCVTMRTTDGNNRLTIGQEDQANKWFGEFWGNGANGYTATTDNTGKAYVEPGATRNVRVTLEGTQATVYIDGMEVYSVNLIASNLIASSVDAITTAGWCGINMQGHVGSEFIIDNIRIISTDAAVGVYNVSGTVTARSGEQMSGAAVELYDGEGNRVAATTTNALGAYQISRVEPGDYTVKVSAPFFQEEDTTISVTNADLTGGNLNFTLDPDLTILTDLIAEVEALTESDYTGETWTDLAEALAAAKLIDSNSSVAAINTAYRDLSNARAALVEREPDPIDYSELRDLYNEMALVEMTGYTAASWETFEAARNNALATLSNGNATQTDVDDAKDALQAAYDALVVEGGSGETPEIPTLPPLSDTTTTTTTNPDGSVTTTVTDNRTGTVTETTVDTDGGKVEKVTIPDEGVTITVTDKDGEELAKVEIPAEIPALDADKTFIDVREGYFAEEAINNMAALGVVNGKGDRIFDPKSPMKRSELAKVLYELANGKEGYTTDFIDVPATKWYADSVAWAVKAGVVKGVSDTEFEPERTITREELAAMLCRYARMLGMDTTAQTSELDVFSDGATTHAWAAADMAWCVQNGILQGKGNGVLDPRSQATRAEVAVMLQRFVNLIK